MNTNPMGDNQNMAGQMSNDLNTPLTPAQGSDYNSVQPPTPPTLDNTQKVNSTSPTINDYANPNAQNNNANPLAQPVETNISQQAEDLSGEPGEATIGDFVQPGVTRPQESTTPDTSPLPTMGNISTDTTTPTAPVDMNTITPDTTPAPSTPVDMNTITPDTTPATSTPVETSMNMQTPAMGDATSTADMSQVAPQMDTTTPEQAPTESAPEMETPAVEMNSAMSTASTAPVSNIDKPTVDTISSGPMTDMLLPSEQVAPTSQRNEEIVNTFEEGGKNKEKKGGTAILIVLITIIGGLLATIIYFAYQLFFA
jgi:hypothetical protein